MSGAFSSPEMRCRICGYRTAAARLGTRCPTDGSILIMGRDLDARPDDPMLGRLVGGKFPVVGILGEGGFGAVYRAIQEPVGRQVALKVIRGGDTVDPEMRARFFREAKIVAALSHPSVVTLHDYGEEDDGLLYIAFELVAGRSLSEIIRSDGPMQPGRVVNLVCQVLSALTEAHNLGLLHRDLKPDNLMVVQGSLGEEKIRLLDFGLSKKFNSESKDSVATRQGIIMGTPRYMSPEQASGHSVDGRSDLYSMGVLVYEMLSGRPPFTHVSPLDLLMAHIGEPTPPLAASLNLPPRLVQAVMKVLSKRADARQQTAAEFARDLQLSVAEPSGGFAATATGSAASMPVLTASSIGLRPARPDDETAEHSVLQEPLPVARAQLTPIATTPLAPPAEPLAQDFGSITAETRAAQQRTFDADADAQARRLAPPVPVAQRKSPAPFILACAGLVIASGVGVFLLVSGDSTPKAPVEPERMAVVVGVNPTAVEPQPPSEPGTAPTPPWERAIEMGKQGRNEEAAAQLIYLMRSSKTPWQVYERAKNDVRLAGALGTPQLKAAMTEFPPRSP